MKEKFLFLPILILTCAIPIFAQDGFDADRAQIWRNFNKGNWQQFDFAKRKLTRTRLRQFKKDTAVVQLELLRGVLFGKRGRIFKERIIQDYLEKQSWYKPSRNYSNKVLTRIERDNLDLIRIAEAERHDFVEPGDMRVWEAKLITGDNLRTYTGAELAILIAEIEAIHGKTFLNEEWLQKYFDERYWYKRNPAYSASVLTPTDRKNLEKLVAEKEKGRKTAVSIGDMDNFQTVLLTEDKLKGLTMLELRMIREEFWARHGKKFDAPGIRSHFEWRDWYKPAKNQKLVKLNKIEEQNISLIEAYEAKIRERLSTELLNDDTLGELFTEDLRVLRNEIYARHGRVFKDADCKRISPPKAGTNPIRISKTNCSARWKARTSKKLKPPRRWQSASSSSSKADKIELMFPRAGNTHTKIKTCQTAVSDVSNEHGRPHTKQWNSFYAPVDGNW